jgi:hypothetical protein
MTKYALVIKNVIDTISLEPQGAPWIAVGDDVFGGFVKSGSNWVPPPVDPAPTSYTIAKSTPWIRMSGDEAELITGAMQQADARMKGIYDASTYLSSADPLWSTLHDMIATTLNSSTRADELLAPET